MPTGTSLAQARQLAEQGLSPVERDGAEMLIVKQGTVVLQASPANFNNWPTYGTPDAGYYVLRDNVALFGNEITNPAQSTDQAGAPDVSFGFTGQGGNKFQNVTAQIANRGSLLSIGNQNLQQHFAVALDKQLVTVPSIDFKQYPDGITGGSGADITGGFTINTAQNLATELRLGALPINLVRISESQVSATLGQQALHQGLVAGLVGIAVVVLFLLAYYRMLGVIAVAGLLVYGIYFYALIKLIPITMTLAGHRRSDPDDRRRGRRQHRHLRTRQGGDPRRQIDPAGHLDRLPQGPDGDHRRERSDDHDGVHPVRAGDRRRQGLRVHARHRHVRVAVHGGDGHPGDPDDDGQLAGDLATIGARRGRQASASGRSTSWGSRGTSSRCPA